MHNRSIVAHSFERDDGMWDIEAELIDTKAYDYAKRDGSTHVAGQPFHHMQVRITIDHDLTIQKAVAVYEAAPFGDECTSIGPAYGDLVGMNLLKGFRQAVKERFGRSAGCSHITELVGVLPTVALQTMANRRHRLRADDEGSEKKSRHRPFQLEGCHALRLEGAIVREFYPEWYRMPATAAPARAEET